MKAKLNCILLVDDSKHDNFLHERVIREAECTEKVVPLESGRVALDYLTTPENGKLSKPDLIFLDINMPGMDGWEFLEAYNELDKSQKGNVVVVMLTTSLNPDDKEKANRIDHIADFINKPLTVEALQEVLDQHFADRKF